VQNSTGIDRSIATNGTPTAISNQTYAAASYLHDLTAGGVPKSQPTHQLEIAIGYYRGNRNKVNKAVGSKGGYDAMLKLRFRGESLGSYIGFVESFK